MIETELNGEMNMKKTEERIVHENNNELTIETQKENLRGDDVNDEENEENNDIIENYEYEIYEDKDKDKNEKNCEEKNNNKEKEVHKEEEAKVSNSLEQNELNIPDKTIFSKLAEDMYAKMLENYGSKKYYNYNEFINDQYLAVYSQKINGNNEETYKNFLERNEQYNKQKVYGEQTKLNRLEQVKELDGKNNKINFTKKRMNDEDIKKFDESQQNFIIRKNKKIQEMIEENKNNLLKELQNKPKVNHNKLDKVFDKKKNIIPFKRANIKEEKKLTPPKKKNKLKLYKSVNKYTKNTKEEKNNSTIKVVNTSISKVNNKKMIKSNTYSNFLLNKPLVINEESKILVFSTFLKKLKSEMISLLSQDLNTNPPLIYSQFFLLLLNLNFIANTKNELKAKEAWNFITQTISSENTIQSEHFVYFLMGIYNILETKNKQKIISLLPSWYNEINISLFAKKQREIISKFKQLYDNRATFILNLKQGPKRYKSLSNFSIENPNNISNNSTHSHSATKFTPSKHRLKLSESYNIILIQRENKLKKIREQQNILNNKECSFTPKISSKYSPNRTPNYLYELSKAKGEVTHFVSTENNDNCNKCSFKPTLTSYNDKMFYSEPIDEDYNVKNQIKRYSKAREERQVKSIMFNKKEGYMKFENEVKKNKDSFDKFKKMKEYDSKQIIKKKMKKVEPLLTFEIKVRNKIVILKYYYGENVKKVADDFVKKYHLNNESKEQIIEAINSKLQKNSY